MLGLRLRCIACYKGRHSLLEKVLLGSECRRLLLVKDITAELPIKGVVDEFVLGNRGD